MMPVMLLALRFRPVVHGTSGIPHWVWMIGLVFSGVLTTLLIRQEVNGATGSNSRWGRLFNMVGTAGMTIAFAVLMLYAP